jgi:hypothetical protein
MITDWWNVLAGIVQLKARTTFCFTTLIIVL